MSRIEQALDDAGQKRELSMFFSKALEFIDNAGHLSYEQICRQAVYNSEALIQILQGTDESVQFLTSRQIDREAVAGRVKNILHGLLFNPAEDYYLAMLLSRDADVSMIHGRWKDLMLVYHPDRHEGAIGWTVANAADCSKRINEIFNVLKDPRKKFTYDQRSDHSSKVNSDGPSFCTRPEKKALLDLMQGNYFAVAISLLFVAVAFTAGVYFLKASPQVASPTGDSHSVDKASSISSSPDDSLKGPSEYAHLPKDELTKRASSERTDNQPAKRSVGLAPVKDAGGDGGVGRSDGVLLAEEVYALINRLTQAYDEGNLNAYLSCYSLSAVESDGLKYDDIKTNYRNIFASGTHHMTIRNIIIRKGRDGITVKGSFNADGYAKPAELRALRGTVEMTLTRESGTLKIKYFHTISGTAVD